LFQELDATAPLAAITWKEEGVFSFSARPIMNGSAARPAINRYRFSKQVVQEGVNIK